MTGVLQIPWLYPALEVVHIAGIALLFGSLVVLHLGLSDRAGDLSRLALAGFGLCVASGLAMFSTQPQDLLVNPAFRLKLLLIALAGINAALYHRQGRRSTGVRQQGRLSLLLWLAVIACGRTIAYL